MRYLSVLFLLSSMLSYGQVQIISIDQEIVISTWGVPSILETDDEYIFQGNILGEESYLLFNGHALGIDEDSLITGWRYRDVEIGGFGVTVATDFIPGGSGFYNYVVKSYAEGAQIGSGMPINPGPSPMIFLGYEQGAHFYQTSATEYQAYESGYIGFMTERPDGIHYGYIECDMQIDGGSIVFNVGKMGVQLAPDVPISAGEASFFLTGDYPISGFVFADTNENGFMDIDEQGFDNFSMLVTNGGLELDITLSPDPYYFAVSEGEYTITPLFDETLWQLTTAAQITTSLSSVDSISEDNNFGLSPLGVQLIIDPTINAQASRCNEQRQHSLDLSNQGNQPYTGIVTYTYDPLCSFVSSTPISDSLVGNTIYFTVNDLLPYSIEEVDVLLQMPSADFIGEEMNFALVVSDLEGTVLASETMSNIVACAFDPNDKTELNGYTDQGFFLPGDELEYVIRFQNTGNDTAYVVSLEDQLSGMFDFSTFEPLAWSHPCQSVLDEEGKLQVFFNDIFLADSTTNEPESHGYYRFRIRTNDNIEGGDVIENTVGIYFDLNEPVITNTTSNAVFDCAGLANFSLPESYCAFEELNLISDELYIEEYEWLLNDELVGESAIHAISLSAPGTYPVQLNVSNPLCAVSQTEDIEILQGVSPNAGDDYSICSLDGELQAIDDGIVGFWTYPEGIVLADSSYAGSGIVAGEYDEYTLVWNQTVGQCAGSDEVQVTFLAPEYLEIQQADDEIIAITFSPGPFDWFLDGELVATTTEGSYMPTVAGWYTLELVGFNGCPTLSLPIEFLISGVAEFGVMEVIIGPNPFDTELQMLLNDCPQEPLLLELRDDLGRLLHNQSITDERSTLSRAGLAMGTYQLTLRTSDGQIVFSRKVSILD